MGDSRFLLEPNVKEGKGGLRDLHTLMWIARVPLSASSEPGELVRQGVLTRQALATFLTLASGSSGPCAATSTI